MSARTKRPALSLFAVAAAAALVFTACGGKSPTAAEEEGPLTKYFGALYDQDAWNEDALNARQQQEQEIIAKCMQEQGFEYKPQILAGAMSAFFDDDAPQYGTEEFAKQYGYGIVESPYTTFSDSSSADPNEAYVSSLSESERAAFYEALSGPGLSEEEFAEAAESGGSPSIDYSKMGCAGKAQQQLQDEGTGVNAAAQDPEFTDLFAALNEYGTDTVEMESVTAEAEKKWAKCMADGGHGDFENTGEANESLQTEWAKLNGWEQEASDTAEESAQAPPPVSAADKEKFLEREKDLAVADAKCRKSTNYEESQRKLMLKQEQEFVDKHKKQLDALVAKYGVKKGDAKKDDAKKNEK